MIGLVLAFFSGFSFSGSNVFIRKATYRSGESFSPFVISVFLGVLFFGLSLLVLKEFGQLASLSWLGVGYLAGAGIVHFVFGRILGYTSLRLIGANRSAPVTRCSLLVAVLLGILFLGEPMTVSLVLALLLIVGGLILTSTTGASVGRKADIHEGSLAKGLFAALGAALCWGASPVLVKIGLREIGSPLVATFVSYTAAAIVAGGLLFNPKNNAKLRQLDRTSLTPSIMGAICVSLAQILRYTALDYSPVSRVAPLTSASGLLLTLPLSYFINREIESFNARIILATIAVVLGVFLIFRTA
ncbi:GRP family sugar transporter [Chloroflexota bacterium]